MVRKSRFNVKLMIFYTLSLNLSKGFRSKNEVCYIAIVLVSILLFPVLNISFCCAHLERYYKIC